MINPPESFIDINAAIRLLIKHPKKRIFFLEGLSRNHTFLKHFIKTDVLFIQLSWFFSIAEFQKEMNYISQYENIDVKNICYLCGTIEELNNASIAGFDAIYVNHNCWLDWEIYKPNPDINKIYDLVINSRPENWKRPYLAEKIKKLAVIKGFNFRPNDYYDLTQLNPEYINQERLSTAQVVDILNAAQMGGSFSESEGACYSSSEYLLCGLPVISTFSTGGRDIWYTGLNSIITNADSISVLKALTEMKEYLMNGLISPEKIRNDHIHLSKIHRKTFENKIKSIFKNDYDDLVELQLNNYYKNKMIDYIHAEVVEDFFDNI